MCQNFYFLLCRSDHHCLESRSQPAPNMTILRSALWHESSAITGKRAVAMFQPCGMPLCHRSNIAGILWHPPSIDKAAVNVLSLRFVFPLRPTQITNPRALVCLFHSFAQLLAHIPPTIIPRASGASFAQLPNLRHNPFLADTCLCDLPESASYILLHPQPAIVCLILHFMPTDVSDSSR